MKKAIDPFEEFLRKKKVELLEKQYRDGNDRSPEGAVEDVVDEPLRVAVKNNDDPVQEAKVSEEMSEFFESGQVAGAEAFEEAKNLSEDKVEEIKDALDGVFESDTPRPQTEEKGDTFVGFFKQVQTEFDEDGRSQAEAPSFPAEDKVALPPAPEADPAPAPKLALAPEPAADLDDLDAVAYEVSSEAEIDADAAAAAAPAPRDEGRLSLAELLLQGEETSLETRVVALCRVVDKLVERGGLPESELIEALIKAGVEF